MVRSGADPRLLAPAIRSLVQSVDRDQPIERIQTMEQVIRDSVARPRFQMLVVGAFAGLALLLALAGIAIGLAGALEATRILARFLFGVKPTDPGTFAAVSLLLLVVAAAAGFIPARRAGRVDPIAAPKCE